MVSAPKPSFNARPTEQICPHGTIKTGRHEIEYQSAVMMYSN